MYENFASNIAAKLNQPTTTGSVLRQHMRDFLDELETPCTYSGQDFDRVQRFAVWLTCLGSRS